jgi:NADPH:quinone reductase-like Zn-dependent oxidoreductase
MKAAVCERYGGAEAIAIREVEKPVPGEGQVLIRIRASSVNPMDSHLIRGKPYIARLALGLRRPKHNRPGVDVAGEVEAVGAGVTRFRPGDAVFGSCRGAFAEYGCTRESALAAIPAGLSFEQAAAIPVAGLTALQALRDYGRLQPGQKVLVNGAAGGIGTFAVQLAKSFGAEVTGVCGAGSADLVRSLGADRAIDYGKEDFSRGGARYDLILDLVQDRGFRRLRRVLTPEGIVVAGGILGARGPSFWWMARWGMRALAGLLLSRFGTRKFAFFVAKLRPEDLAELAALAAAGQVTPVIDRRYSLDRAAEAIGYHLQGHAHGKVIVAMAADATETRDG